jgi:hypothetical protein
MKGLIQASRGALYREESKDRLSAGWRSLIKARVLAN